MVHYEKKCFVSNRGENFYPKAKISNLYENVWSIMWISAYILPLSHTCFQKKLLLNVCCTFLETFSYVHMYVWTIKTLDVHGGVVDKNPPASAGDLGSIPGPGRFHMSRNNLACVSQLLKPVCPETVLCNKRRHPVRNPCTGTRSSPLLPKLEKAPAKKRRSSVAKN